MARPLGVGIVVEHCVKAKVVEIRKRKARAGVKEMVGHKVVEVDAAVSIIGIKPILVTHVEVVDPARISKIRVVAKQIAVGQLQVINAVPEENLTGKEIGMCETSLRAVSAAGVQKQKPTTKSTPDNHFSAGPDCSVTGSGRGRVSRARERPIIRNRVISAAGVVE